MQAETAFKNKVRADLKNLPRTWFVKTQQVAVRGTPDLLCCVGGTFVALELKRDQKAKIDQLQVHTLGCIARAGGLAYLVTPENWPQILARLEALAFNA